MNFCRSGCGTARGTTQHPLKNSNFSLHEADNASLHVQELWIRYGSGNAVRDIPIHGFCLVLGRRRSDAFTVCDVVSFFVGVGKITAWKIWMSDDSFTTAFWAISHPLEAISPQVFALQCRFTVLLFDAKCSSGDINAVRCTLFEAARSVFLIPPTEALRALFVAGHLWGKAHVQFPTAAPSPANWGWKIENGLVKVVWTTQADVFSACRRELNVCGCKSGCSTQRGPPAAASMGAARAALCHLHCGASR